MRDSVPWDTTCIRTKNAISIHCKYFFSSRIFLFLTPRQHVAQYPYRAVQIVLRLYRSPAEVMAGFDVDACCVAFDGNRVWANPRSIMALMTQSNTVDMTRRSPSYVSQALLCLPRLHQHFSYEVRLAKYSARGFEVHVPTLRRPDIDPTVRVCIRSV